MKILLLNPRIDAAHEMTKKLTSLGVALFHPADATEAFQILQLHGTSIDLALIHREGSKEGSEEAGLGLITKIKAAPDMADLPIILSSEKWGDPEFTTHQATPQGVNAYLKWPFPTKQAVEFIDAILGSTLGGTQEQAGEVSAPVAEMPAAALQAVPPPAATASEAPPQAVEQFEAPEGGTVLQDLGEVLNASRSFGAIRGFGELH
ncbi:MAG: hypothetical protein HYX41_00250 [Bdellovibrio sp.]|nr:hypothetical protein [Bdellovibrio sp.]